MSQEWGRDGWIDAAFASAFLLTMGLCIWPGWFEWPVRAVLLVLPCAACCGDERWSVRLKWVVPIAGVGLWVGGLRYWYLLDQAVPSADVWGFGVVLAGMAGAALWRPLPRDAAMT